METAIHYVLIVANRTAAAATLLERVRERAQRSPCEFTLLVPTPPGVLAAEQAARTSIARALPLLAQAAGGTVRALMVSAEPLVAVERTLANDHFDEALVSTLPEQVSAWLKADLPARIERPWLPVSVVNASSDPQRARAAAVRRRRRTPPEARRRRHPGRSAAHTITLRDGSELVLRPVGPQDQKLLAGLVDALSDETSYRRFLSPKSRLTKAELRYLTDVDHRDHDALLALDSQTGAAVAVARYIRDPRHADAAEFAILVGDQWQARGLGRALSTRLAQRARANGIQRFRALTLAGRKSRSDLLCHGSGSTRRFWRRGRGDGGNGRSRGTPTSGECSNPLGAGDLWCRCRQRDLSLSPDRDCPRRIGDCLAHIARRADRSVREQLRAIQLADTRRRGRHSTGRDLRHGGRSRRSARTAVEVSAFCPLPRSRSGAARVERASRGTRRFLCSPGRHHLACSRRICSARGTRADSTGSSPAPATPQPPPPSLPRYRRAAPAPALREPITATPWPREPPPPNLPEPTPSGASDVLYAPTTGMLQWKYEQGRAVSRQDVLAVIKARGSLKALSTFIGHANIAERRPPDCRQTAARRHARRADRLFLRVRRCS